MGIYEPIQFKIRNKNWKIKLQLVSYIILFFIKDFNIILTNNLRFRL